MIEEKLLKEFKEAELYSLKYKIINNIQNFIEIGRVNSETVNKVYQFLKENNIHSEYFDVLGKHIPIEKKYIFIIF